MLCKPLTHLAAGALCFTLARASNEEVKTCDPSTGTCAAAEFDGDDMSAIQLKRGGPVEQQETPKTPSKYPGQGDYWDVVSWDDMTELMPYSKTKDDIPQCFKGIFWMDQQCLSYDKMPKRTKDMKTPCLGRIAPYMWVDEFATSFHAWDEKTKCFKAQRKGWIFGEANISTGVCAGDGILACQDNARTHGPCDVGATFRMKMGMALPDWFFVKTEWGWLRKTPLWLPFYSYYAVQQVVDGDGKKTEWWKDMEDEALRLECPADATEIGGPRGCRKSEWASTRQVGMCSGESGYERATDGGR